MVITFIKKILTSLTVYNFQFSWVFMNFVIKTLAAT